MKKILVLAAIIMLLPVSAMAGMTAFMNMDELSSNDMQTVTGQTGITIVADITTVDNYVAWGDNDGFGANTTAGYVTLSTMNVSNQSVTVTIDSGTVTTGSYVAISIPSMSILQTIAAVRIGDAVQAGPSIGYIESLTNLTGTTIKIYGH